MTKRELIDRLQDSTMPDDATVQIWDPDVGSLMPVTGWVGNPDAGTIVLCSDTDEDTGP